MSLPSVAIVGRPNVGKSSIFNALAKKRLAIVSDYAGVTRDRNYTTMSFAENSCILIDTGGLIDQDDTMQHQLNAQTHLAIEEADHILFIIDAAAGITTDDEQLAQSIRRYNKQVTVIANKSETQAAKMRAYECHSLGFGEPLCISAAHNIGLYDLQEHISTCIANLVEDSDTSDNLESNKRIQFALIGKPNTGKSTLTNTILGREQVITDDYAGTTRDSVAFPIDYCGNQYTIIDTAGVRRKSKVSNSVERFSVIRSLQAIAQVHVVVYMIDITKGVSDQDFKLINHAIDEGKALIIALNKTDLCDKATLKTATQDITEKLSFAYYAPIIPICAQSGKGLSPLWRSIYQAYQAAHTDMSTSQLTEMLRAALAKNPPPMSGGRTIKLQLAHPGGNNPPTIIIHGKQTDKLSAQYKRYLSKQFYQKLGLKSTPLRLFFRQADNPYV